MQNGGIFQALTPQVITAAVEQNYELSLDGMLTGYPSYINRVYGVTDQRENRYVVKFYRPGRWTEAAIREEHQFLHDCAEAEIPVVAPLQDRDGDTVGILEVCVGDDYRDYCFALFPLRGGRSFDAEGEQDWLRLGRLISRVHLTGRTRGVFHRLECHPKSTTEPFLQELLREDLIHPDCRQEFESLVAATVSDITPLFEGVPVQRIHGDCHRGNILNRLEEGLLLFDFDDMMKGPVVQDLWLLLPDHAYNCRKEIALLIEGYEEFQPFPYDTLKLIEPLRMMRMIYFLVWWARQRHDPGFLHHYPGWGTKAYWVKELEDLISQREAIETWFRSSTA